jgi:rhodanese-related sulfurtransferase
MSILQIIPIPSPQLLEEEVLRGRLLLFDVRDDNAFSNMGRIQKKKCDEE